jgi:hypothetical protein
MEHIPTKTLAEELLPASPMTLPPPPPPPQSTELQRWRPPVVTGVAIYSLFLVGVVLVRLVQVVCYEHRGFDTPEHMLLSSILLTFSLLAGISSVGLLILQPWAWFASLILHLIIAVFLSARLIIVFHEKLLLPPTPQSLSALLVIFCMFIASTATIILILLKGTRRAFARRSL